MTWSTAAADLRTKLSDNTTDRLRAYKRVLGNMNGTNKIFKTFEYRRITNFTTASSPLGIYKNSVLLANAAFTSDDTTTGYFTLVTAPVDGDVLEATYYVQYFTDDELITFLASGSKFLGFSNDYTVVPDGLQAGALEYAAGEAYAKLALRFADTMSDTYRMEDMPDKERQMIISSFKDASAAAFKEAKEKRNDYYENRQGQALAPLFGTNLGNVRDVPPNV